MSEPMHPILQTSRSEIADACRDPQMNRDLEGHPEGLALAVEQASEETIAHIARKLGDRLMEGAEYWQALPAVAEDVLGVQVEPPKPAIEPIESDAPIGPRSRPSDLAGEHSLGL